MRAPENSDGFTLIEVLAALVIVSLGMMGVIQAVNQTVNNTRYLREKSIAHWVAMNRLTEARLATAAPAIETTHDNVQMAGRDWRWTMAVSATDVESMLRIDVNVAAADADEKSSLVSVSGFYGKAIAPVGFARVSWDSNVNAAAGQQSGTSGTTGTGTSGSNNAAGSTTAGSGTN